MTLRLVLALLLFALSGVQAAHAQTRLRLHGSNTIGETLAPTLAEAWLRQSGYGDIQRRELAFEELELHARRGDRTLVVEIHAQGSGTIASDLIAGRADIGMSSRPVQPAEVERALALGRLDSPAQEIVLGLDGLAIIVHPNNPLASLDVGRLRRIFTGELRDWSQLGGRAGAIALHARDDKSGTYDTFKNLVLQGGALARDVRRYESTAQLAAAIASDPNAVGFVGLSGVSAAVRALAIADGGEALRPDVLQVAVEDYPLSRRLYLYIAQEAPPLARDFIAFALSPRGQEIVEANGFVSQQIRSYPGQIRRDLPDAYAHLVADAQRLSLNFRFGDGLSLLDSRAFRDLDRLGAFMRQPEYRGRQVLLLGFVDAGEVVPYLALSLSNDRADYVAGELAARGVAAGKVRGLGGIAPVASNETPLGRQRNRRVEVWLR